MTRDWKIWTGILVSAVFLVLAFNRVDPDELLYTLECAEYVYLIPCFLLITFSMLIRALRWRYIIQPVKHMRFGNLFSATAIGLMANNLLPARLGEVVRAYVIGEHEGISKSTSFATVVVERIFDGFVLLFFLAVIVVVGSFSLPGWLRNASFIALVLYIIAILFLILLRVKTEAARAGAHTLLRPFPERFISFVTGILDSFIEGLKILHNSRNIIISFVLSAFVWLPLVFVIHLLLKSFGIQLPLYASFVLQVALCIGAMIPSAPAFIGTIQYLSVAVLALFAVPKHQALSFSIVYNSSIFISMTVVGLVCLIVSGVSLSEIRGPMQQREDSS